MDLFHRTVFNEDDDFFSVWHTQNKVSNGFVLAS